MLSKDEVHELADNVSRVFSGHLEAASTVRAAIFAVASAVKLDSEEGDQLVRGLAVDINKFVGVVDTEFFKSL